MSVAQKLGIALLVGIVLAASDFQGTTLATDSSQTSASSHARITRAQAERAAWLQDRNVEHFWVTTHYRISRIPSPLPIGGVLGEVVEAGPVSRHKMQLHLRLRERHAVS
jgi:hypothetical protein